MSKTGSKAALTRLLSNLPPDCPIRSPWGTVDYGVKVADGIFKVSTPSHGGFRLYAKHNGRIPEPFRIEDGWYEEDIDWAVVIYFLPEFFSEKEVQEARKTLRAWKWQTWERHFGEEIPLAESPYKRNDLAYLQQGVSI